MMRRLIGIAAVFTLALGVFFSCASCSESDPLTADELQMAFTANAVISQDDTAITCRVTRTQEGLATVAVLSPQLLAGLAFEWQGDGYAITYSGLVCETQQPFLPSSCFASALIGALDQAANPENLTLQSENGGSTIFTGTCPSGDFTLEADSATGVVQKINIASLNLTAELLPAE